MIHEASALSILVFFVFAGLVVGISFYLGAQAKSASGYFAADGRFLVRQRRRVRRRLPFGRVVPRHLRHDRLLRLRRLSVLDRLPGRLDRGPVRHRRAAEAAGQFTFADALDSQFNSRGIKLAAAISTLVVSCFYLIPQMVGAGALVKPLLGFPHWVGVLMVGASSC